MEEDKAIKRKKLIKKLTKIISCFLITAISIILFFITFYIAINKIYDKKGKMAPFTLYTTISSSMEPTIKVYDVIFIKKTDFNKLKNGDIITFYSTNEYYGKTPITHRIVSRENDGVEDYFIVKGDNNIDPDTEKVIEQNILGKVLFKINGLGKIQFFLASKSGWIIAILIPALAVIAYDIYKVIKLLLNRIRISKMENKNGNI